jgi:hypothetical protein
MPDDNRYGGDNAYTDILLEYPPPGVRYFHYEDLLSKGLVRKIKNLYRLGPRLESWGILPPDLWAEYLASDFIPDLVHIFNFSTTLKFPKGIKVPIILHASSPSITDLIVKRNWDRKLVDSFYRRKRLFLKVTKAHHYALNADRAIRVLVQTKYGRDLILSYGDIAAENVQVLYPAQPFRGDGNSCSVEIRVR